MIDWDRVLWAGGIALVLALLGGLFVRACCVTNVDSYEMGYRYDLRDGQISRINRTGYVPHVPVLVEVHTVDLRPMQVCINANARVLNCKLVQFQAEGLETFLAWHGRANYINGESAGSSKNLNPILMSYAFDGSGKTYPFLKILRELRSEEKESNDGR